jgi:hypothetical protein
VPLALTVTVAWRLRHTDNPPRITVVPSSPEPAPVVSHEVAPVSTGRKPAWTIYGPNPFSTPRTKLGATVPRSLMLQLAAATTTEDRLRIVDLTINTTQPVEVVSLIRQLFMTPPGKPADADPLRTGLLERLPRVKEAPMAFDLMIEATDVKYSRAVRMAAVAAMLVVENDLPQDGSRRLATIAQGDPDADVQARASTRHK